MATVKVNIFYMSAIVGTNGKARFVGPQYINIVNANVGNVVGCFGAYLEQVAIGIANDIADFVIAGRAGETEGAIRPGFYNII